ncbi:MAG TPA: putative LPS assembly protein LptD, partial [Flavobacteriales bacterium]|nr:putative LPS assembly protein LptD [Flavobacteriales bacterium]
NNGVKHTASATTTFKTKLFTINPEFRVTDRWYFETLHKTAITGDDTTYTVTDTVPGFERVGEWGAGATLTSKLYGMYTFHGEGLKAIRHVITPSATLSYRPDQNTEIIGPYGVDGATSSYSPFDMGIYGKPGTGASGLLNLSLIQSLEAKVRDNKTTVDSTGHGLVAFKKIKLIDFLGINSNYDLLADSVHWSPVNISARTAFFNRINVNLTSNWDPYAVNEFGQRIDRSERSQTGRLARMTYTNVAIGFDLKSKRYGQAPEPANSGERKVVEDPDPNKGARVNFSLPWHLGVNYSYDINRSYSGGTSTDSQRQSALFNGDVTVFKYWKLGVMTGYDLVAKEWTPTTLNLYWDLHCWEFNFNIIPIGIRKSYSFQINVKASILRDMRYKQTRPYGNTGNLLY